MQPSGVDFVYVVQANSGRCAHQPFAVVQGTALAAILFPAALRRLLYRARFRSGRRRGGFDPERGRAAAVGIEALTLSPALGDFNEDLAAFHSGSGVIGALIVGGLAGGATLAIGQIVFATVRTPPIRAAIGLLYAVPAAIAGYHATLGLAHIGMPSEAWRETFAVVGGVLVGGTAWGRMFLFLPPNGGQGVAAGSAHLPLSAATTQG